MGSTRSAPTAPDLFSRSSSQAGSRPTLASNAFNPDKPQRHVLPHDLPAAVKQLNDQELEQLLSAVLLEQERRGARNPPSDIRADNKRLGPTVPSLPSGKLNAIRAAFKAGVTPSRIAREFGLSQSNVRKALAVDKATR
jgi:hypothetical protein